MDQYHHLSETLDYSGNMLSSAHHLMNQQHQLQAPHQASQQPQYTQLHASAQHRNLNNSVMNNLNGANMNNGNVPLMNGQKSNGTANGQVNSGTANLNGNHNGNHNANHGAGHSANHNGNHNSINGNASNSSHGGGPNANSLVHHNQNAQQAHLNQQLMQLGGQAASSPPQHQSPAIQHAQMSHEHLHSLENRLENSPQLTNLTNSNGNGQQQPETKYTPPNQSMKRKLDDYLEPHGISDGLLNEGRSFALRFSAH